MIDFYQFLVYALAYIGLFFLSFYVLSFARTKNQSIPHEAHNLSVSIIIPAYNESASIQKTIRSALELDYPKDKLEIIVVDDGSKDTTYALAEKLASSQVRVFRKPNGGKASALNYGIARARGEIIVTMDADTFAERPALKRIIARFYRADIMAVNSSIAIYHPKTFWQRIQHIEYYLTVFLKRAFSLVNAIYITSGAFSAYRKSFFEKHGGYQEGNITEDLEIALRIQSHDYTIEYSPDSVLYTLGPRTFRDLLYQRRRWYTGLVRNLWVYRTRLFGKKRGALGTLILPSVILSIILSLVLTAYTAFRLVDSIQDELFMLGSVNFNFVNAYELNVYLLQQFFFTFFSNPLYVFTLFFIGVTLFYLQYARRRLLFKESLFFHMIIFLLFYGLLFSFWWIISLLYLLFNKRVEWRRENGA